MAADARDLPVGEVRAVLTVVGRGDLAFASLHRRPLLQHALAALEELLPGRVSVVADPATSVVRRRRSGTARSRSSHRPSGARSRRRPARPGAGARPAVPAGGGRVPAEVLVAGAGDPDASVVAFRPVTDTVKNMSGSRITGTVDRETLATVASPVLVAAGTLARAGAADALPLGSGTALTAWVHRHGPVRMLRAPSLARRVDDLASLHLLQCLDEVRRRTRSG